MAVSEAQRRSFAKKGIAEPDGSFYIRNATDLSNALKDFNRTGQKPSDKTHILQRAKALGLTKMLPISWMT